MSKALTKSNRPGLMSDGEKISTSALATLMRSEAHILKKPDGSSVSMPKDVDLLVELMPKLWEYLPEDYTIITRPQKYRKALVDDKKLVLDDDGKPVIPDAPIGLSGVEAIMWQEIGAMAPKACCWLYMWMTERKYKKAIAYTGLQSYQILALKKASTVFDSLYTCVEGVVNKTRHIESVEENFRRGTEGVLEPVFGATVDEDGKSAGSGIVGEKRVFSDKCLHKGMDAEDPNKYRGSGGVQGGVMVQILVGSAINQARPEDVNTASKVKVEEIEEAETV